MIEFPVTGEQIEAPVLVVVPALVSEPESEKEPGESEEGHDGLSVDR